MENVILVIHLILALSIIGLVLIQRSEGGGLGIGGGGGGGMGGLATPQGTANMLTRMTAVLAACFFGTSLVLAILAGTHSGGRSIIDSVDTAPATAIEGSADTVNADAPVTKDAKKTESAAESGDGAPANEGGKDSSGTRSDNAAKNNADSNQKGRSLLDDAPSVPVSE